MKHIKAHHQAGNAIFYILIAIAMLSALTYAVSQNNRGGAGLTEDRARLYATEIIEYGNIVGNAVAQLRLRGCEENQINFEHASVTGYTNTNAPADDFCDIFSITAGGVERKSIPSEATQSAASPDYVWDIVSGNEISEVGSSGGAASNAELLLTAGELKQSVCIEINELLDVTNPSGTPPEENDFDTTKFIGSFAGNEVIGDTATTLKGQKAACLLNQTNSTYLYYKAIMAR